MDEDELEEYNGASLQVRKRAADRACCDEPCDRPLPMVIVCNGIPCKQHSASDLSRLRVPKLSSIDSESYPGTCLFLV